MSELERTRTREPGTIPDSNYERFMQHRKQFDSRQLTGPVVVKKSDREYEVNRQGRLIYYLDPVNFKDTPLQDWHVFSHDIRTHSGRHRHQGGLVIYVIEGRGYSEVDGERIDWRKGDLLLLPLKPEGVEHQHFNLDPGSPCHWVAFVNVPIFDYLASEIVQTAISPEFGKQTT
jgi:hypothetical protein